MIAGLLCIPQSRPFWPLCRISTTVSTFKALNHAGTVARSALARSLAMLGVVTRPDTGVSSSSDMLSKSEARLVWTVGEVRRLV